MNLWLKQIEESDKRETTKKDEKDRTMKLWRFTEGVITPEKLIDYASKYKHKEDRRIARNFLTFAAEQLNAPILKTWAKRFLEAPKKKKERSLYAEEEEEATKNINDIQKAIDKILNSKMTDASKLRLVAGVVLAASIGLRPYELGRLTFDMLKQAINKGYFILPAEISKTPFKRITPVNKESRELLKAVFEVKKSIRGDKPFTYKTMTNNLRDYKIPLTLEDLRHFATTYSLTVLGVPGITEAAVAAHDTDKYGIRLEHYVKKKPEEIRDDYLKFWNDVNILTNRQRKEVEKLVNELRK
ncbi:hypothetical protein DRO97_07640 [Archaeoglobales archaeon]|nr:MAG: hypothetical protein DRO97_07640 [Archaeoglobales archaeon]